jgi:hypothetical protein
MCYFFIFQKKLPKVSNHPISENSPNMVTLFGSFTYLRNNKNGECVDTMARDLA